MTMPDRANARDTGEAAGVPNDQSPCSEMYLLVAIGAEFTRSCDGLCNARYIERVSNNRHRASIIDRREFFNDTLPTVRTMPILWINRGRMAKIIN